MEAITQGARIFSRTHRSGEIQVDVAGSRVILGRMVKRNGELGREVILRREDVSVVRLELPCRMK